MRDDLHRISAALGAVGVRVLKGDAAGGAIVKESLR
jgi:hypothetical protein